MNSSKRIEYKFSFWAWEMQDDFCQLWRGSEP